MGASRVRRPRGEEETRLLHFRADGGELGNRRADYIADSVVAEDSVAAAAAREGVITRTVQHLATPAIGGVLIPQWQTESTLWGQPEEGGGNVRISARRLGSE